MSPPLVAWTGPANGVPATNGAMGRRWAAAISTTAATSAVVCGKQTMSGEAGVWYDSP